MNEHDIRSLFPAGMKVRIINAVFEAHRSRYCNRVGTVTRAVKSKNLVWIEFPNGEQYGARPENIEPA